MATISLRKTHSRPEPEVRALVEELAASLTQRYDVEAVWIDDNTVKINHNRMSGKLSMQPNQVCIEVRLGFLAGAFKSKIESELRKSLDEKLS
ncbi:MAG: putative polyhydroxyalkanoate system protein [Bermanella sp.]|jgi:putative polyhydroxyalkanoate system protein